MEGWVGRGIMINDAVEMSPTIYFFKCTKQTFLPCRGSFRWNVAVSKGYLLLFILNKQTTSNFECWFCLARTLTLLNRNTFNIFRNIAKCIKALLRHLVCSWFTDTHCNITRFRRKTLLKF